MRFREERSISMMEALATVANIELEFLNRQTQDEMIRKAYADIPEVLQEGQPELDPDAPDYVDRIMERVQIFHHYVEMYKDIPSYALHLREALFPNVQWVYDLTSTESGSVAEYEVMSIEEAIAVGIPLEPLVSEEPAMDEHHDEVQNQEEYADFGDDSDIEDYLDVNELVEYEPGYDGSCSETEEEEPF